MTKSEVRAVSVAKLELSPDSIVYDVGAGTGSVTVEAALAASSGKVYAIEKNGEACELIRKNCARFGLKNVEILEGRAPELFASLPAPDAVFIGGTGGGMEAVLDAVAAFGPKVRVVLTVVTLESLSQIQIYCKNHGIEPEMVLLQTARARQAGTYHLMAGGNPIYIISWGESRWDMYLV